MWKFVLFGLISWIDSNQAVKPRSGLRSLIISLFQLLVLPQFHKIPTTNPKITLCSTSLSLLVNISTICSFVLTGFITISS